jgi:hypothetical protein
VRASDGRASEVELPRAERDGPALVERPDGRARVESYTVEFDKANCPLRAMYVLRLEDERRTLAVAEGEEAQFERILTREAVGLRGSVTAGAGEAPNRFRLDP